MKGLFYIALVVIFLIICECLVITGVVLNERVNLNKGFSNEEINFRVDEKTIDTLEELKDYFGLETNSALFKRSIALLKVAKNELEKGGRMVIKTTNEETKEVSEKEIYFF